MPAQPTRHRAPLEEKPGLAQLRGQFFAPRRQTGRPLGFLGAINEAAYRQARFDRSRKLRENRAVGGYVVEDNNEWHAVVASASSKNALRNS